MKSLYLFGGMIVTGVMILLFSSYRILDVLGASKSGGGRPSGLQTYVTVSYLGVGLFLLGAFGAIIMMLRAMNRK